MTPFAAILAGGSGTRFWPASTREVPKQMLPLTGGAPLLLETVRRLDRYVPIERTLVVTAEHQAADVRKLLPHLPAANVLTEPRARNTSAACALAAWECARREPGSTLLTLPADHVVEPVEEFVAALSAAANRASEKGTLVTLGLEPTRAATGYGWIEMGAHAGDSEGLPVHTVARFVEKPDRGAAEILLARGGHLWNLGMFAWRTDVFLEELERHVPQVAGPLARAGAALGSAGAEEAIRAAYDETLAISVDYGVLERSDRVECLPCTFAWDDLGSFAAVARHLPEDEDGNVGVGSRLAVDARRCTTWATDGSLTALLGVEDLIVVHTARVTMVARRGRAEEVKRLVEALSERGLEDFA